MIRFAPLLLLFFTAQCALAEVARFEIKSRTPFAQGKTFGNSGAYEKIVGRVYFELDPNMHQNRFVIDLKRAPRNKRGKVECWSDLFILAPKDLTRGNGALIYDVNNRGNKLALRFFNFGGGGNNPTSAGHAGDGFLMRQGFTIVWSGWDGELIPGNNRLRLSPPSVRGSNNKPMTGMVRCEMVPNSDTQRMMVNWGNHGSYRPTKRGLANATLTHRVRPNDPRKTVPTKEWNVFVNEVKSDSKTQLPKVELELAPGFKAGHIYELIYEARDPVVMGTCFTTVRDLVSSLMQGTGKNHPLLANGLPFLTRAHAFGVSQSGRFLREFLYWGFNEDEAGRKVFSGVIPHVSGSGQGSFNHRFAQPTRHATQHDHDDYIPDRFPFSYEVQFDAYTGKAEGILERCDASGTTPFVLHTQSTAEYWTRSGSLSHTDPQSRRDSVVPPSVRIFLFGGTQHGPSGFPPSKGLGKTMANPGDYRPFLRALLVAMDRAASKPKVHSLPPSVYPKLYDRTLVSWQQKFTGFPKIPGVTYPPVIRQPPLLDLGPRWDKQRIIDVQPPRIVRRYRVRVPKCDADGNDVACLSPPEVAVPVATYTGWNLRSKRAGAENELVSLRGSYIPFAISRAERLAKKDPRLSLEERYGSFSTYMALLTKKCHELQRKGYLLEEDVKRTLSLQARRVRPLFKRLAISQAASKIKQVVAHRGVSGECPECSLPAIQRAIELRVPVVEVDVRMSRDHKLFLFHDSSLERTSNGRGRPESKSLAELKTLDAGSWFSPAFRDLRIATLSEAMKVCNGRIDLLLDLKGKGKAFVDLVIRTVQKDGDPTRTIIGVRSVAQASEFRRRLPAVRQLGLIPSIKHIGVFADAGVETIRLWPKWLKTKQSKSLIDQVRSRGLALHVNGRIGSREEAMQIIAFGADSTSSDYPGRMLKTLKALREAR